MNTTTQKTSVFNFTFEVKCIILLVVGLVFYANTITNQYALDDGIVIIHNEYVQQGFGGIGKILSTDAYDSYYRSMSANQMLAGGRYRPLSIVVFAIEHQIFGESPFIRHLVSIIAYLFCILTIFFFCNNYLLKKVKYGSDIAFLSALIFAIHPMHTEVVANVKSLDEIMSLTLIMLTFIFSLRYFESEKKSDLFLGMLFYFLSLLAKEYAVMLVFVIPLLFYVLAEKDIPGALISSLPYYAVVGFYMLIRIKSVGMPKHVPSDEILNNPYMLATHTQKIASEIFVLGKYLYMLFFPYPLSSDYSYNQLPYRNFSDPMVLLTLTIYIASFIWLIRLIIKKNILAIPLAFYLVNLAMVSNFLLDIGATMGERLAFHSSMGFVVILSYGIFTLLQKVSLQQKKIAVFSFAGLVTVLSLAETWPRNAQWKSDVTLFTHDVHVVPNSVMVNGNAGARYIELSEMKENAAKSNQLLDTAIFYLRKSIAMHKTYTNSYLNIGVAYYKLEMPDSAKYYWDIAKKLYPDHPSLKQYWPLLAQQYMNKAMGLGKEGKLTEAIRLLIKALREDKNNPDVWYNLGGAYFTEKQYDSARYAWGVTLGLKADYPQAKQGMGALPPPTKGVEINGVQ